MDSEFKYTCFDMMPFTNYFLFCDAMKRSTDLTMEQFQALRLAHNDNDLMFDIKAEVQRQVLRNLNFLMIFPFGLSL